MVVITFSFAQADSKKMSEKYTGMKPHAAQQLGFIAAIKAISQNN
jgi:hypothetical protein